jgi:hypothetical protein
VEQSAVCRFGSWPSLRRCANRPGEAVTSVFPHARLVFKDYRKVLTRLVDFLISTHVASATGTHNRTDRVWSKNEIVTIAR